MHHRMQECRQLICYFLSPVEFPAYVCYSLQLNSGTDCYSIIWLHLYLYIYFGNNKLIQDMLQ